MITATTLLLLALGHGDPVTPATSTPIDCGPCAGWNAPQAPFRIHGNSWYVGPEGLSALLLASDDGLLLIDGALPQSADAIAERIESLGFRVADIRWILLSHAHFDHAGGIAELQRRSGARVGTTVAAARALRLGGVEPDDPQAALGDAMHFPPLAAEVDIVAFEDGQKLQLGELVITALHTPGHTPGGSSWHWSSCEEQQCVTMLYADSLSAVSADGFRFSDHPALVADFRRSIERIGALDCQLLVSTHPGFSGVFERLAARESGAADSFVDPQACRRYADNAAEQLQRRLQREADELASDAVAR